MVNAPSGDADGDLSGHDLARYGPAGSVSRRVARLTGAAFARCDPVGGQHGTRHYLGTLADGRAVFVKEGPADQIMAEAHGLRWLREAAVAAIPEVIAVGDGLLVLPRLPAGRADAVAAERFGRELAALHQAGASAFGAAWTGFIAGLPLPNEQASSWPSWYARCRVLPYVAIARNAGTLGSADVRLLESVCDQIDSLAGPAEPPSRIHGDCWSGNVLWSSGRGWLIDPAAHGGHRETDLAMLALFGMAFWERILAGYQEIAPLSAGWRARVPLHQLHPLLVHVCLFGGGYRQSALTAARDALSA